MRENIEYVVILCSFPIQIKQSENEAALSQLQERLNYLDSLTPKEREVELVVGLLAGNMFDWGARAVVDIMVNESFGLKEARDKIPGIQTQMLLIMII